MGPTSADPALLERLSRILHDMGLPCACQEEVERTIAVFSEFETRRAQKRLLDGARERARQLTAYVEYLQDLECDDGGSLTSEDLAGIADIFRTIAAAAAEGAASLEMLSGSPMKGQDP